MTYWVIREGKVRGQGRYYVADVNAVGGMDFGWSDEPDALRMAIRLERKAAALLDASNHSCRLVRVTRKPKLNALAYEAKLAIRNTALDDAERVCHERAEEWFDFEPAHQALKRAADAIAALKR